MREMPGANGVVSYVRRSPRMNPSQRQTMDRLAATYLITPPRGSSSTSIAADAHIDWANEFGSHFNPAGPIIVEIGSGTGDALVASALAHPDAVLIGFEVYQRAVATTMAKLAAAGISNVRLVMADAVQGLDYLFSPGTITRLHTFFPDPWQKKRHHKRRIISPGFAELACDRLAAGGYWLLATDWPDYADQMRAVLDATPGLVNEYSHLGGWAPRPDERPITRFEARGLAAGRPVADLVYRRLP